MSGFTLDWLELREPADHRSVNADIRQQLVRHIGDRSPISIVDLGCGTGSNLRGLAPFLGREQVWRLVDHDTTLLRAADTRLRGWAQSAADTSGALRLHLGHRTVRMSFCKADLSNGDLTRIIEGSNLVTAAALFDLVSYALIERVAEAVASSHQTFYTVLTYDGMTDWCPEHPADTAMRNAFNHHQRSEKGLGLATGPAATDALAAAFARHGYAVVRGKSRWVLDHGFAALRRKLVEGWAEAVRETRLVPQAAVEQWLRQRLADENAVTIVGHEDLLALPPAAVPGC